MAGLYDIWNNFFNSLDSIKRGIEPIANRSGLTADSALLLIIINDYSDITPCENENLIKPLCDKGLIEYNESKPFVTSKGAILAKSLSMALKKL